VLWELFSRGNVPYPTFSNAQTMEQVIAGYRMPAPTNCPAEVYQLMLQCWQANPAQRPSFAQLFTQLQQLDNHQRTTTATTTTVRTTPRFDPVQGSYIM
jgi:hypothetical protein